MNVMNVSALEGSTKIDVCRSVAVTKYKNKRKEYGAHSKDGINNLQG